jgi:hypothetical protein
MWENNDVPFIPQCFEEFDAMPGWSSASIMKSDQRLLLLLQRRALRYFLDNQGADGLIQDRQSNHGPTRQNEPLSLSATGMGLIALALSSAKPYRLISRDDAIDRVRLALETGLDRVPNDRGVMPHFVRRETLKPIGEDAFSTVDSSWFVAGALWAATFLRDGNLDNLASQIYKRVDWRYWSTPSKSVDPWQIRHGKQANGKFLPCRWDRANGETVMMYVLAAGADDDRSTPGETWHSLQTFYGEVAGHRFNNADLGLFVFQYGIDLLNLRAWRSPTGLDLMAEAAIAAIANHDACRASAARFQTYRQHWGLSAGDGPGARPGLDAYCDYSPAKSLDGTAHLTATLASVAHHPTVVLDNIRAALESPGRSPLGRYGLSCINKDQQWIGRDMVGIDAGAVVMALDNVLMEDRVRAVFHEIPGVHRGLERLGFRDVSSVRRAS